MADLTQANAFPDTAIDDDALVASYKYKPELKRQLGAFGSFAIAYSMISITMGIFSNFGYVLKGSGPIGIWTWIFVAIGQTLVATIFAELSGRIPLSGYSYQWVSRLGGRGIGWITGVIALCNLAFSGLAVDIVCAPLVAGLFGYEMTPRLQTGIVVGLLTIQFLLNSYKIRLAVKINNFAVFTEIFGILGMAILLILALVMHGHWHPEFLFTKQMPASGPYWPQFLLATLLGSWALVGFESAADVAETVNARRNVPYAILGSIILSAVLGFAILVLLTVAMPDLPTIAASDNPIIAILQYHWGRTIASIFTVSIIFSIFACGMLLFTIPSRLVFAMARDQAFPASGFFARVSPQGIPRNAVLLIYAMTVAMALVADKLTSLLAASSILFAVIYLITITTYAIKIKSLPPTQSFSLHRGRGVIITAAIVWLILELGILIIPEDFHNGAFAAGGVCLAGIVLYWTVYRRKLSRL
jgi:amino acid transporter